ncbi:MAG: hypothetical protein II857_12450 [Selenomonadaceae bacterium]|nr:hypothetical protein [Selenomonadaceae bacterium]
MNTFNALDRLDFDFFRCCRRGCSNFSRIRSCKTQFRKTINFASRGTTPTAIFWLIRNLNKIYYAKELGYNG